MALVLGTNCGFVTEAPVDDPNGGAGGQTIDNAAHVTKDVSPATAIKIIEIGWWCNTATPSVNFEVGLYAADGAVVPGEAGTLLEVDRTNTKGTTAGWKSVVVDWDIDPDTAYWLGVQVDDTSPATTVDVSNLGVGLGWDDRGSQSTLPNPYGGGTFSATRAAAIYAVYETEAVGTNMKINISDVFKDIESLKINIGDAWKNVIKVQQNIGDVWKTVFG